MSDRKNSARHRLIQAAIRLFLQQGVTDTTTRQIAELAEVNEVTLFRNFGSKQGLLLAVIEDWEIFERLETALADRSRVDSTPAAALQNYADAYLKALAEIPEFVRSLIGEAGQFSPQLRGALGRKLAGANRYTGQYLATVLPNSVASRSIEIASLLNPLLLGYAVLEFSSDSENGTAAPERRATFLTDLVELFLPDTVKTEHVKAMVDLLPQQVHSILQRSKKAGTQDYALAYVLFAAGLSVNEIINLQQSHLLRGSELLLQVAGRQVPLNQWILGRRYGSRSRNPLTQWLKSRKDDQTAMFISATGEPMPTIELRRRWQRWVEQDMSAGEAAAIGKAQPETIEQAQQTWCIEMLRRGVSLADLSILSGKPLTELQPYVSRAREKSAIEEAIRLDQKPGRAAKTE